MVAFGEWGGWASSKRQKGWGVGRERVWVISRGSVVSLYLETSRNSNKCSL
jgi:hypothetical protein